MKLISPLKKHYKKHIFLKGGALYTDWENEYIDTGAMKQGYDQYGHVITWMPAPPGPIRTAKTIATAKPDLTIKGKRSFNKLIDYSPGKLLGII